MGAERLLGFDQLFIEFMSSYFGSTSPGFTQVLHSARTNPHVALRDWATDADCYAQGLCQSIKSYG
jgi:hypothetical protein